jgi:hypothetical protein
MLGIIAQPKGSTMADKAKPGDDRPGSDRSSATTPGPFFDFIGQLRQMADQLDMTKGFPAAAMPAGIPTMPAVPQLPGFGALPMLPPPGAMSEAQLTAMTSAVAAQRSSIEGLMSQLKAFDEQLEVFERVLVPLAEWSRNWADLERAVLPPGTPGIKRPD